MNYSQQARNLRRCLLASLLAGVGAVASAEDHPVDPNAAAALESQQSAAAASANRDSTILSLVSQWSSSAPGGASNQWVHEFTQGLKKASPQQLVAIGQATSFDGVRAILQGRSTPVSQSDIAGTANLGDTSTDMLYTPVTPCRIIDTRSDGDGATPVPAGQTRNYYVYGSAATLAPQGHTAGTGCSSPRGEPVAIHANFTAVPTNSGHLRVFPYLASLPNASIVNYVAGNNIANAANIATCYFCGQEISIYNASSVNYIADVLGYFYPADTYADPNIAEVEQVSSNSGGASILADGALHFVGPTLLLYTSPYQKIFMVANQALGTTTGASGLYIYPCYQDYYGGPIFTIGGGIFNLQSSSGNRTTININGVFDIGGSTSGWNYVGMCYSTTNGNWNNNEWGYVSAMVVK